MLPAFGFRESAHAVDGKIAKWVQQALEDTLQKVKDESSTEHATLQGLIKKIKDKRLTFSVKVPHAITLRQLGFIIADAIEENDPLPEYVQRQCTRDQVQRWYTQMKIIHEARVQKRKAEHEASRASRPWEHHSDLDPLPPVSETFIHDDAFSTTPLPAMEDALKVMMKFQDVENVENVFKKR